MFLVRNKRKVCCGVKTHSPPPRIIWSTPIHLTTDVCSHITMTPMSVSLPLDYIEEPNIYARSMQQVGSHK